MNTATHETNGKAHHPPVDPGIELGLIDPSPSQPRRTFDEAKLRELADDIKEHGVLQDVLVRPSPAKKGRFELVFGERRLRASKLAGLTHIPAKVRSLTDAQVLEIQIVENAKRADIHPLEEARAYEALHKTHGYTIEEIAAKVAKSTTTISQRLKLVALGPEARKAFLEGRFSVAVALVVASVPAGPRQKSMLEELLRYGGDGEMVPKSDAIHILETKYRLRLADASFDRADGQLVAGAPACSACPERTGAQADLFGASKDDFCLNATCFESKCDAAWKKRVDAKAENERALPDKQGKKLLAYGHLAYDSEFVDLADKSYSAGNKSYGTLLGKKRDDVEVVLARDETGRMHELVSKKEFAKAVPKSGVRPPPPSSSKSPKAKSHSDAKKDWEKKERELRAKHEAERKERCSQIEAIASAAMKQAPNDGFWRVVVRALLRMDGIGGPGESLVLAALGLKKPKGISVYSEKFRQQTVAAATKLKADKARSVLAMLLLSDVADDPSETFADFQELYSINVKPAKETPKPKAKPKKATTKKKAPKKKAARK